MGSIMHTRRYLLPLLGLVMAFALIAGPAPTQAQTPTDWDEVAKKPFEKYGAI
jgi:hypothetical protein